MLVWYDRTELSCYLSYSNLVYSVPNEELIMRNEEGDLGRARTLLYDYRGTSIPFVHHELEEVLVGSQDSRANQLHTMILVQDRKTGRYGVRSCGLLCMLAWWNE